MCFNELQSCYLTEINASIDLAVDTGIKDIKVTGHFNLDYVIKSFKKQHITEQIHVHWLIFSIFVFWPYV